MAVFAPIPSAIVRMTVRAKPGDLRNWRKAMRTSCIGALGAIGTHYKQLRFRGPNSSTQVFQCLYLPMPLQSGVHLRHCTGQFRTIQTDIQYVVRRTEMRTVPDYFLVVGYWRNILSTAVLTCSTSFCFLSLSFSDAMPRHTSFFWLASMRSTTSWPLWTETIVVDPGTAPHIRKF